MASREAVGVARQPGRFDSPKLEVRFAPRWLSALLARLERQGFELDRLEATRQAR